MPTHDTQGTTRMVNIKVLLRQVYYGQSNNSIIIRRNVIRHTWVQVQDGLLFAQLSWWFLFTIGNNSGRERREMLKESIPRT